jgi:leucyl-tRNA synthetase
MSVPRYDPSIIEPAWQKRWDEAGLFQTERRDGRPKLYVLEMFPYPSGRLHMGHVSNYSIGDVYARYHKRLGYDVLHPMGWDAFGLPAENAAIEHGVHPAQWTDQNIDQMREQFRRLGFSFDWGRELSTCHPDYYRWEQWFFLRMYERGIAYRKEATVNWCPRCNTVLANEQVVDGCCERHDDTPVERRFLPSWYLKITEYAQELLDGLDTLDGWPERVRSMQRNWLGRSEGAWIRFPIEGSEESLDVFTTRADTLYGVTFMSVAPEHPLAAELGELGGRREAVEAFIEEMAAQDEDERLGENAPKRGCFTGAHVQHPLTGDRVPIYLANFVVATYGTGAVMAVPAHDQRDFEFAKEMGIELRVVIRPEDAEAPRADDLEQAFVEYGVMVNSGEFDGSSSEGGRLAVAEALAARDLGGPQVQWRLRDWNVSRQRYWGTPIPIIYCEGCGEVPVPDADLPVVHPRDVVLGEGSALAQHEAFVHVDCPTCGAAARRETDTFDTFVESSWYNWRFTSPRDEERMVDPAAARAWGPVDQYIGGVEHAVMHLLYFRFFHKVMRDLGVLPSDLPEPATRLLTQGMVCMESYRLPDGRYVYPHEVEDGVHTATGQKVAVGRVEKMSKTKKNVVEPETIVGRYGVDTARLYVLFASPPEKDVIWRADDLEGCARFIGRMWRLVHEALPVVGDVPVFAGAQGDLSGDAAALRAEVHRAVADVSDDIGRRMHFNTAIAKIMSAAGALSRFAGEGGASLQAMDTTSLEVYRESLELVVNLLDPFAPHVAAELWSVLGYEDYLSVRPWPKADEAALIRELVTVAVQVLGKVRGTVDVPAEATQEEVLEAARAVPNVARHLEGKTLRKVVYVPGRLVNLVAN